MCFITFVWLLVYVQECEDRKQEIDFYNSKKSWKREMTIRYRAYITHDTGSIRVRTISAETFSEAIDDALEQATKEENSFPDKIVIKEDIIYL